MNQIPEKQNTPQMLRLLLARGRIYDEAERLQVAQFAVAAAAPVLGVMAGLALAGLRPWVAALAVLSALLDTAWLDRALKSRLRVAAGVSELFDCEVLQMPWNDFVAGKRPEPEVVEAAAATSTRDPNTLREWYAPSEIGNIPLALARLVCQRENLWYNSTLRRRGGAVLLWTTTATVVLLWLTGLVLGLSLRDFIMTLVVPVSPLATWAIRERFRQGDTADALEQIKSAAEAFWEEAVQSGADDVQSARRSREFQDAIFLRRAASPLPLPWLYGRLRASMEREMSAGAAELVRQATGLAHSTSQVEIPVASRG
ncbi:S-4TM family putative pore-forming effector [Acidisoma sp. C75]